MHFFFDLLELYLIFQKQCFTSNGLFHDEREPDLRADGQSPLKWYVDVVNGGQRPSAFYCTNAGECQRRKINEIFRVVWCHACLFLNVCHAVRYKTQCKSKQKLLLWQNETYFFTRSKINYFISQKKLVSFYKFSWIKAIKQFKTITISKSRRDIYLLQYLL